MSSKKPTIKARLQAMFGSNHRRGLIKLGFCYACPRCDGQGSLRAFGHVANGVCFLCEGNRVFPNKVTSKNIASVEVAHAFTKNFNYGSFVLTAVSPKWKSSRIGVKALFV